MMDISAYFNLGNSYSLDTKNKYTTIIKSKQKIQRMIAKFKRNGHGNKHKQTEVT